jgi:RNA polymerase sigma-B factor
MEEREAQEALSAGSAYCADSLQAEGGQEDGFGTVEETVPAPHRELESADVRLTMLQSMRALPALERRIVALRFWGDLTQREIAPRVGVSQVQVSRLLQRALGRMRGDLRSEPRGPV